MLRLRRFLLQADQDREEMRKAMESEMQRQQQQFFQSSVFMPALPAVEPVVPAEKIELRSENPQENIETLKAKLEEVCLYFIYLNLSSDRKYEIWLK